MKEKKILLVAFFCFTTLIVHAQIGINFQGVARSNNNIILASQPITLRLSILQGSANGVVEYVEVKKVITNAQGLFSIVIGDEDTINTIGNFSNINWKNTPKYLKIEMDLTAGNNFTTIGTTQFQYVPYAQFAKAVAAENIVGILPIEKGGTGVASTKALKIALELGSKANQIDLDSGLNTKVDKVAGKSLTTNDFTTAEKTKLAAITGVNSGDQDLSKYATISSLALKADSIKIDSALALKANLKDLLNKENVVNKSTASDLGGNSPSNILYPTQKAVKDYITANVNIVGIADGGVSTLKLANGAVTLQKFQNIPPNTIIGNSNSISSTIQTIPTTGSDNVVLSTSPTISSPVLITPNIGNATALSINNVSIEALNPQLETASITVRGETYLRGNNRGDDAPNQRYEDILISGIVSLATDQPVDGKKTFQNDLQMGNIGGIGTSSPTTINFANGSRIGDIQNLMEISPDANGSIDLYAPDGAKWVQMNYGNLNYIALDNQSATIFIKGFDNNDFEWKFNQYGETIIPGSVYARKEINFYQRDDNDNNASIQNNGPFLKIYSRMYTEEEEGNGDDYGIELNYADRSFLEIDDVSMQYRIHDSYSGSSSYLKSRAENFTYSVRNNDNSLYYLWKFDGENAKTSLPGDLEVTGDLKLGDIRFSNQGGLEGDVLTYDGSGHAVWQAPITSNGNLSGILSLNSLNDDNQSFAIGTDGIDFNISSASGIHTFNIPNASSSNRGLLTSSDYDLFYGKQDLLTNPIIGTGINGQLSYFNTTNSITSSANLFWNENNNRLGIRNNNPSYPFEINQEQDNYGFMLNAPKGNTWGSTIGFQSNIGSGSVTNTGLFQLDGDGAMVFRTLQNNMYFDNEGSGNIYFRLGKTSNGMRLDNSYNLHVDGNVSSAGNAISSDIRLKKNILPLKNSLSLINQLNPVSYNKKTSLLSNSFPISENGFIAQELEKVLPNLVHASEDKDHILSVNYTAIIPILTKGIQEQQEQIELLKKEVQELKKLIQTNIKTK